LLKLYAASTEPLSDERLFASLCQTVTEQRLEKINRLRSQAEKRRSLAASCLLSRVLRMNGVDSQTSHYGENGKPYLTDAPTVFFNLSHSGERVMCALSDREVGCDVEKMRDIDCSVAKRFFHPDEYKALLAADEEARQDLFFRLWTLKESALKAAGIGMVFPLSSLRCNVLSEPFRLKAEWNGLSFFAKEIPFESGYRYAVCSLCEPNGELEFLNLSE